jgi:hypothetical protein
MTTNKIAKKTYIILGPNGQEHRAVFNYDPEGM